MRTGLEGVGTTRKGMVLREMAGVIARRWDDVGGDPFDLDPLIRRIEGLLQRAGHG